MLWLNRLLSDFMSFSVWRLLNFSRNSYSFFFGGGEEAMGVEVRGQRIRGEALNIFCGLCRGKYF